MSNQNLPLQSQEYESLEDEIIWDIWRNEMTFLEYKAKYFENPKYRKAYINVEGKDLTYYDEDMIMKLNHEGLHIRKYSTFNFFFEGKDEGEKRIAELEEQRKEQERLDNRAWYTKTWDWTKDIVKENFEVIIQGVIISVLAAIIIFLLFRYWGWGSPQ